MNEWESYLWNKREQQEGDSIKVSKSWENTCWYSSIVTQTRKQTNQKHDIKNGRDVNYGSCELVVIDSIDFYFASEEG